VPSDARGRDLPESFSFVVFDLDGTLIDSRQDIARSANALLEDCGATPLPEERIGRMVGDGAATLVARAFAASGLEPPRDALSRFLTLYDHRLLDSTRPYPQVPEVLEVLSARHHLAVLTNKPLAPTRRILAGLHLDQYFQEAWVIGGDGPFPRKPDPAALRHLVTVSGHTLDSTLLVGDSVIDWRTSLNAPTAFCLARYGFGFEGFPIEERAASGRRGFEFEIDAPERLLGLRELFESVSRGDL
jgi:phosphoglycolate phosphatase